VDPLWPKPLPNHWVLGSVTGVAVDAGTHLDHASRRRFARNNEKGAILNPDRLLVPAHKFSNLIKRAI